MGQNVYYFTKDFQLYRRRKLTQKIFKENFVAFAEIIIKIEREKIIVSCAFQVYNC